MFKTLRAPELELYTKSFTVLLKASAKCFDEPWTATKKKKINCSLFGRFFWMKVRTNFPSWPVTLTAWLIKKKNFKNSSLFCSVHWRRNCACPQPRPWFEPVHLNNKPWQLLLDPLLSCCTQPSNIFIRFLKALRWLYPGANSHPKSGDVRENFPRGKLVCELSPCWQRKLWLSQHPGLH